MRTKEHDFYGRDLTDQGNEDKKLQHAEMDIEFYTDIKNSISYFALHIINIMNAAKKDLFKAWVGEPNNFKAISDAIVDGWDAPDADKYMYRNLVNHLNRPQFPFDVLQKKNYNKWKAAVKIFYEAVKHLL